MRLAKDILTNGYKKPRIFLCETDKEKICELHTTDTKGSFKFNAYSELSFTVGRTYNDPFTGENFVNPYYDKIETLRLIYLEEFGYFEIQSADVSSDGIKETKSVTAYSLEYTLSQKYLSQFHINTGELTSVEVSPESSNTAPIILYDENNQNTSLMHLILRKTYGWSIGYVEPSLQKLSRSFEVDRSSIYDFLMNDVCERFNCYIVFDTIDNTINIYAQSLTAKFYGDGKTNKFSISPPFETINTVAVSGYKTTRWSYDNKTGALVLSDVPEVGAYIEVVDGSLQKWDTDVYITFENLSQEMNVSCSADDIKTILTVTYGDDNDISEANLGLPYITDLSYYCTPDWFGQDLYLAYIAYSQKCNQMQAKYTDNSQKMIDVQGHIDFEKNRLSLEYSLAQNVSSKTQGTYYIRGGSDPDYYYTEVTLPKDYNANTQYYSISTTNLNEEKVDDLIEVFKKYFNQEDWESELNTLSNDFQFMAESMMTLRMDLTSAISNDNATIAIKKFCNEMWNEIGHTPLKSIYHEKYTNVQLLHIETKHSEKTNPEYWGYYSIVVVLDSIDSAITQRESTINEYQKQYDSLLAENLSIGKELAMDNNFTPGQLVRLSAFLREDELQLDDIIETEQDTYAESFKIKQDAIESGRIELNKRSQPQLQFSMTMANIYALPEFEPIIHQFQLGNVIKVALRPDYIKQSRLMQVDIGFDDFSDFSCEFGDLTSVRTQSDIHADLLSQAISAGKSVAQNASYWTKGTDRATSIDKRLEEGLLNSIESLKTMGANQHSYIDKYGIHLEVVDDDGNVGDERVWLCNNQIVFTDDAFETSKTALGKFKIGEKSKYGLIADAVLAGYIEGSTMKGGTINIGDGNFVVDQNGQVTMNSGTVKGYVTESEMNNLQKSVPIRSDSMPTSKNDGQIWINTSTTPSTLMIYDSGHWKYFSQQTGGSVYTTSAAPTDYKEGDIWIPPSGNTFKKAVEQDGIVIWVDANPDMTQLLSDVDQTFTFNKNSSNGKLEGLTIGQSDDKFKVNITSQRMSFYDGNTEVVYISNNSTTIKNATFEGEHVRIQTDTQFNDDVMFGKFRWKVDADGSLSLEVI